MRKVQPTSETMIKLQSSVQDNNYWETPQFTMAIITLGKQLARDLEQAGALGMYVPPEGGYEGRYQRRLRAIGYDTLVLTARGLGDLSAYLTAVHGIRPPHLGKKTVDRDTAVGYVYYTVPQLSSRLEQLPDRAKGLVLWLLEGWVLSNEELQYLVGLPKADPRVKVVVEVGGDRYCHWQALGDTLRAA